jgi:nuclear protein localization protein 4 homolog
VFDFKRTRVAYLYGSFGDDNSVSVECIYEPPQENTDITFKILDDPLEDRVTQLANLLGLKKVGWVFTHPPREKGYQFSGYEVLTAAELQLECADGIEDTNFITVKCTLNEEGKPDAEGYQVNKQCMELVAEVERDLY